MNTLSILVSILLTVLLPSTALADENVSSGSDLSKAPLFGNATAGGGEVVAGTADCFDYYHFGSAVPELTAQVTPGASGKGMTVTFTGQVKNNNPYPLVGLDIYVKIFRKQKDESLELKNGDLLAQQFIAVKGLAIDGNSTQPIQFDWLVPEGTIPGNYELSTYAIVNQKYNLAGLSFTDDVAASKVDFTIPGDAHGVIEWDKNHVTVNDKPYLFATFIPQFSADEPVTVDAPLVNTTSTAQTSSVTWKLYNWDGQRESELLDTMTDTVTVAAGATKHLTYTATKHTGSVSYIVADVNTNDVHSILDMRFARQGVSQARINFPSLASFPLKKGQETTIFSCLHGVGPEVLENGQLTLSLTDENGQSIVEDVYTGKIGSTMMGVAKKFVPANDTYKATLTATLVLNGKVVEQNKTVYDCAAINPASCPNLPVSDHENTSSTHGSFIVMLALIIILIIMGFFLWRRRSSSSGGSSSVPPVAPLAVFVAMFLCGVGVFGVPSQVYAKSVTVTAPTFSTTLMDTFNRCTGSATICDGEPSWDHIDPTYGTPGGYKLTWGPIFTVSGITSSLSYQADAVVNGTNLSDGATVAVGTTIDFQPKVPTNTDVTWNGTGGFNDSPYGYWGSGSPAVFTTVSSIVGPVDLYLALNVVAPTLATVTISHGGTAGLSCVNNGWTCTVTSAGTMTTTITIPATTGTLEGAFNKSKTCLQNVCPPSGNYWYTAGYHDGYYPMQDTAKLSAFGCAYDANMSYTKVGTCAGNSTATETVVSYPGSSISFSFTVTAPTPAIDVHF